MNYSGSKKIGIILGGILYFTSLPSAYSQLPDYSDVVDTVSNCIVSLIAISANEDSQTLGLNSDNFRRGTGIVLSEDGYVLTNHHIVQGASRYFVELRNGFVFEGRLVGSDYATDLAVLDIDIENHPTCEFIDDGEEVQSGQFILGLGSPYSLPGTVTEGVISYVDRPMPTEGVYSDYVLYIQTDLEINPGNSGGPVINQDGLIIGMNSSLLSDSGISSGIAFAIPANILLRVSRQLIVNGFSEKGSIGVEVSPLPRTIQEIQQLGLLERRGAIISDVEIGGPAYEAGIRTGDIVVTIDRAVVEDDHKFRYLIGIQDAGDNVRLSIIREGRYFSTEVPIVGRTIGGLE